MIEVQSLTRLYGSTVAVKNVSFTINNHEIVGLLGHNGAGKTTVFQLLLRFYDPVAGSVRIDGADVRTADPVDVRRRVALVPQEPAIFAASVRENVRYGIRGPRLRDGGRSARVPVLEHGD